MRSTILLVFAFLAGGAALNLPVSRRAVLGAALVGAAASPTAALASSLRPKSTKASREAAKEYKYAPRPVMDENYKIVNADVAQGSELGAFYKEKGKGFRSEAQAEKASYRQQQQIIEAQLKGKQ